MLRAEFESKIACKVEDGGFGGGVAECCVLAECANADARNTASDYNTRRIFEFRLLAEEGCKSVVVTTELATHAVF